MINIRIERDVTGHITGFCIKGHAGYSKYGHDVVCAGVSAISQTAYIGLKHFLVRTFEATIKEGYLEIMLPELPPEEFEAAEVILTTMLMGLESLREGYPKFIVIEDAIQEV